MKMGGVWMFGMDYVYIAGTRTQHRRTRKMASWGVGLYWSGFCLRGNTTGHTAGASVWALASEPAFIKSGQLDAWTHRFFGLLSFQAAGLCCLASCSVSQAVLYDTVARGMRVQSHR